METSSCSLDAGRCGSRTGTSLLQLVFGDEKHLFFPVSEGFPQETREGKRAKAKERAKKRRVEKAKRDAKIAELWAKKIPAKEIASEVGCSPVTVYRVLNRQKNGGRQE